MSDRAQYLSKYVQYIRNTNRVPLAIAQFDDDWEPIGPMVRRDLVAEGLIVEAADGITLAPVPLLVRHAVPRATPSPNIDELTVDGGA